MRLAPFTLGLIAALVTLGLDQASKLYLLHVVGLPVNYPLDVLPFLEFTPVWNRGVSWGMFQQDSGLGRWLLTGFQIAAAVGLALWMWRARSRAVALGLGLIIGGAVGNAIDRASYGAVFDFIHFHTPVFDFIYVFNVADAAIVLGVPCLLYPEANVDEPAKEKP